MSSDPAVARTYANALLAAAGGDASAVADELDELVASISSEGAIWQQVVAPEHSTQSRRAIVDSISEGAKPASRNLLRVLNDHGRLLDLPAIAAAYRELVKVREGKLDVEITTAVELPDALRKRLEDRLSSSTGQQVSLHASVDPKIIGGLVVQHGDTLIDTSLRSRLETLRLRLGSRTALS